MKPLNAALRIWVYALHGVAVEIMYTAAWDLVVNRNLKLHGISHGWAFPIYGLAIFGIEMCHKALRDKLNIPLAFRCVFYACVTLMWEFSTGFVLRQFNACPWDYAPWFHFHVLGLITFEYFPLWYFSTMFAEVYLIRYTLRLNLSERDRPEPRSASTHRRKSQY